VVDPFLAPREPGRRSHTLGIFRRSAMEWRALILAGTPVEAPTLAQTLRSWRRDVHPSSPTPAIMQRMNYFRMARLAGRWVGGRLARPPR
jgi:hypothetical protein